jgi:hypothetical protein
LVETEQREIETKRRERNWLGWEQGGELRNSFV